MEDLIKRLLSRAEFEDNGGTCDRQMEDVGALLREAAQSISRLERLVRNRDSLAESSRKFWVRAAKAAMAGDFRELRNRVDLSEAPPLQIIQSERGSNA